MLRKNIFLFEFKQHLRSFIGWSAGILAIHFIYLPFFKPFSENARILEESLKQFPQAFLEAFGMGRISMATVLGFYSLIFLFVQILLAIQSAKYGVTLVSREENERTMDFLLTKPVSRWEIINSKLLAALLVLIMTQALLWISAFAGWEIFKGEHNYDKKQLALLLSSAFPFQLFFLGTGLALSQMVRRIKNPTPYALGLGMGTYVIGALRDIGKETILEWFTPFKYFEPAEMVLNGYELRYLILNLALTMAGFLFGYWRFLHRDIASVS